MKLNSFASCLALTIMLTAGCLIAVSAQAQVEMKVVQVPAPKTTTEHQYQLPMIGFEIEKPAAWQFLMKIEPSADKPETRLPDNLIETAAHELGARPLVVVTKYPETHPSLNPTVQVAMRPADHVEGQPASEILKVLLASMQSALPDLELVEPIAETLLSGLPAAHFVAKYTVSSPNGIFPTKMRMWVVPRGPVFFVIGMSGAQAGEDMSEAEFQQIFDSLVIAS